MSPDIGDVRSTPASRRSALLLVGGAGLVAAAPKRVGREQAGPSSVATTTDLLRIDPAGVAAGTVVHTAGYHVPGDGGGGGYRWDPDARTPENGGTVLQPV